MLNLGNTSKFKRQALRFLPRLRYLLFALGAGLVLVLAFLLLPPVLKVVHKFVSGPGTVISFAQDPQKVLRSTNDRTNVLLLGVGGSGHEGADLTDSMMVVSFNHANHSLAMISVPRDLWVTSMKAKINTAYHYGEEKQKGGGLVAAKAAVEEVIGLPIHYGFVVDFDGFVKAVDLLGGIDVNVEHTFDDFLYPIAGKENAEPESARYEHIHFDAGIEHMSGERALKFVRSRHAQGDEGTDFARSARQKRVLLAVKEKVLSTQTLLNPSKLKDLLGLFNQYIDTDITQNEYPAFAKVFVSLDRSQIKNIALTTGDKDKEQIGILEVADKTKFDGQWVLIPKDNNTKALIQYIQNQLNN